MIQHRLITLTLAQFGTILRIPFVGQAAFNDEWDLEALEAHQETDGPYYTELPTPNEIRLYLGLERMEVDRTIKSKKPYSYSISCSSKGVKG